MPSITSLTADETSKTCESCGGTSTNTVDVLFSDSSHEWVCVPCGNKIFNTSTVYTSNNTMASDYNSGSMLFNPIYKDANGICEWCATNTTFNIYNPTNKASVDNLDPELTIGNITETPFFRCKGGDASGSGWTKWTYGEDLDFVSDGTDPTYNAGSPCFGSNDDSVKFNLGDYYKADNTTLGNFGTDDFVIELIFCLGDPLFMRMLSKKNGASGTGWTLYYDTTPRIAFTMRDTSNSFLVCTTIVPHTWNHVLIFVDRNESSGSGARLFRNGFDIDGADPSSVGNVDYANPLSIGAMETGANPVDGSFAYIAMWKKANWMQGGTTNATEWGDIAKARFAKLSGRYPYVFKGDPTPTSATRSTAAYMDKIESNKRVLYYAGPEWLRQCHRQDKDGVDVYGYLSESQVTNLLAYSKDLTNWTKIDSGDSVSADAATCPDKITLKDGIIADTTDGEHGFTRTATLTAATYTFSCFFEPGNKNWLYLQDTTVSNCWCYFNCSTGVVGASGAGATGYIEGPFVDDSYRCCIVFTGTAASHTLKVSVANADNDNTFAGDGSTTNGYFWGMQVERSDYMSSPIVTDGATATRSKDTLKIAGGDNIGGEDVGEGTIVLDLLLPDYAKSDSLFFASLSDGGSSSDRVTMSSFSNEYARTETRASGGDSGTVTPAVDIADGKVHELRSKWDTNNLVMVVDKDTSATDTDCDMPDDLDQIEVGGRADQNPRVQGLIRDLRIYPIITDKG